MRMGAEDLPHKASYWHVEGQALRCDLCPWRCSIEASQVGHCGTRRNDAGRMTALNYAKVCVSAVDPIEKKPVFHYQPGARLLSLGTFGCNLDCGNCQNSSLARMTASEAPYELMDPEMVIAQAKEKGVQGVAFTYNEPVVWIEYILDVAAKARENGMFTLINTNGYIEPWAGDDLFENIEVANIDIKSMHDSFYRSQCGGRLKPVKESCNNALDADVHLELTYLMIPGMNDSENEVGRFCEWVADELGVDIPVHFFRFQPSYRMANLPAETEERLLMAYELAKDIGLDFVYFGGVVDDPHQNTLCPKCGRILIERSSKEAEENTFVLDQKMSRFCPTYTNVRVHFDGRKCPDCGTLIPLVLSP